MGGGPDSGRAADVDQQEEEEKCDFLHDKRPLYDRPGRAAGALGNADRGVGAGDGHY